ncbi:MAG TPA: hypothetical protein VHH15_10645 [Actinophytocola sp.]|nr:hypothetical protein [Actinophytocola sp.]
MRAKTVLGLLVVTCTHNPLRPDRTTAETVLGLVSSAFCPPAP